MRTNNLNKNIKPISQEHPMGCSVACVASLCGLSYQEALSLFNTPKLAWGRGFYCGEIVEALTRKKLAYKFEKFINKKHKEILAEPGTIIFTAADKTYPAGHFFLRAETGWMNPWSNYPQMIPVETSIQTEIYGKISYLIFEV